MKKIKRVAVISDNSPCCVNAVLKSWNKGYSVMLLDISWPLQYILEIIDAGRVEKCYIDKSYCNIYIKALIGVEIEALNDCINPCLLSRNDYERYYKQIYEKKEALVLFSSGTSGQKKGICLTHYAINKNADSIIDYMKNTSNDIFYILKNINHSSTFIGEILVALKKGSSMLFCPTKSSINMIVNNIKNYGITILGANPLLLKYICGYDDYGKLKKIYCSGSGMSQDMWNKIREKMKGIKIYNVYGLTEAGPRVCSQELCGHGNSVGKPIQGVSVKILDSNGFELKRGKIGVVYVKTESCFTGYLNSNLSMQEWIDTKDLGYIDEYNELNIVGRSDNMIQINSHNIYPEVIEDIICDRTDINDCIVYKEQPRGCLKEKLICIYLADDVKNTKQIRKKLKNVLAPYELPEVFYKAKGDFYNNNGKKQRIKRREDYEV